MVAQGPIFKSISINKGKCFISFSEIGTGLAIHDGKTLNQFQIAGADKVFKWAKAEILNNQVVVWSDDLETPMYVRYAYGDNPVGANLYNNEGLPAAPFSTLNN